MAYTMTSALGLVPRKEKPTGIQELAAPAINALTDGLATTSKILELVAIRKQKLEDDERHAQIAFMVQQQMQAAYDEEDNEEEQSSTPSFWNIIFKFLKFVGRTIIKYVVRPLITFAIRMVSFLARFVLRALFVYVIQPIIAAVVAFFIANPITATVGAIFLAAGGAYYYYKKMMGQPAGDLTIPKEMPAEPVTLPYEAPSTDVGTAIVAPGQKKAEPALVYKKTMMESIKSAPKAVTNFVSGGPTPTATAPVGAKASGKGFKGFGDDVDGYIVESSSKSGIPVDILRGFVKMEGGWTGAMSPTGAIGTGQFIQSTWNSLSKTAEGQAIGMTPITNATFRTPQDPRFDKRVNTLATGLLAKGNAQMLTKAGIPVTGENLYMMHNIGPGIIPVMLGQPASNATILAMQQNGMLPGQTPAQFLEYQKKRFSQHYADANQPAAASTSVAAATTVKDTKGISVEAKKKDVAMAGAASGSPAGVPSAGTTKDKDIIKTKTGKLMGV